MFLVITAALLTHLIFKTTETNRPIHLGILLIVVPSLLTAIVAPHWTSYLKTAAVVFSTFYLTLTSSIVIYRLSPLHPLARHPGPLLCRVSKFYMAFLSLGGKQHIYYTRLHERYGDVVRIGPNELSIRDINAIGPIMGPHGFPKGPFWDGRIAASDTKALIALRDSTEHTRRRKPWTRAFNTAALKGYEEIIIKRCTQFVEGVDAEKGAADLSKWISFFTYDFMTDFAFGGGVEMMRDGDVDGLWHLLEAGQKTSVFMTHVPWFGQLCMGLPGLAEDIKAFIEHSKRCAIERATHGSDYKDLFYHIMNEGGEDADPTTIEEAVSDGAVAIIAGADTTSSVLANFIYFLLVNPQSYKRVQSEIDTLGDEIMDFGKQARLPYLTAALNESLRLYPPVLSGSQRHVDTGTVIGDYFVPKGTNVFIPSFCLQRDSRNFSPLPHQFIPERWLSPELQTELEPKIFNDSTTATKTNTVAFIPFSYGPSNCVGKNLAWMEMRMLVCLLLSKYELKFEDGYDMTRWEEELHDYFVTLKGKLSVVLTPRMQ